MNGRLRECVQCPNPITHRVAYRRADQPKPERVVTMEGTFLSISNYADVCDDHIDYYKKAWEHMSGYPPGTYVVDVYPQEPPPPLPVGHHVKLKTWFGDSERLKYDYWPGFGLRIECETFAPESRIGQKTTVVIDDAQIVLLLRLLKDVAIEQRSKPLGDCGVGESDCG